MHGLAVYVKEGLPFAHDSSLENFEYSYLCFGLALLHSLSYFFSAIICLLCLCAQFLIQFHLKQMRFSRSTYLLMLLSLEILKSIIRTGLPILVELIDLVKSVVIYLSQMTLLRCLTFLLESQTVILIVLLFWIYFFLLALVFVLQWLSLHWEILIVLPQFPLIYHQIHKWMPCFIAQFMTILMLIGMVFVII